MNPTREEMEEFRQDMLQSEYLDYTFEVKMRSDDDFFYDYIVDRFSDCFEDFKRTLSMYDREDNLDDWIGLLLEKQESK